jgi:hypothetical protein
MALAGNQQASTYQDFYFPALSQTPGNAVLVNLQGITPDNIRETKRIANLIKHH